MSLCMRRRDILVRLGLLGAGIGGAWWLRDNVIWRGPQIGYVEGGSSGWLPYARRRAATPTVEVEVGGRRVAALVDSGAQFSVIDAALFADLGLAETFSMPLIAYGVGGNPQLGRGATIDVAVGELRLSGLRAAILQLGPLASERGLGTPLILGQDVLRELVLDLDTVGRRLRLSRPEDHQAPTGLVPIEVRRADRGLSAAVTVEGAEIEAVVDTGASALLAVSRQAAEGAGLLNGRESRQGVSIVLGGATRADIVRARTVTFGDTLVEDAEVAIFADVAVPGFPRALLGMEAFAGRQVVMDIGRARLLVSEAMDVTVGRPRRD